MADTYYLGIDGGATKTTFLLVDECGNIINKTKLSSSNPIDIGLKNSYEILQEGISKTLNGIPFGDVSLYAGISGGSTGKMKAFIREFLSGFGFKYFENGSDALNCVMAGLGRKNGIAVIMGTGCVAFSQCNGELRRYGGLGYLFDGAGGGFDFGCSAIKYSCMMEDGTGGTTKIRKYVLEQSGFDNVIKNLDYFYSINKSGIAQYAPCVFKAYKDHDVIAEELVSFNINHVANLINTAKRNTKKEGGKFLVSICGGLLKDEDIIIPALKNKVGEDCDVNVLENEVVYGAVYLAGLKNKIRDQ